MYLSLILLRKQQNYLLTNYVRMKTSSSKSYTCMHVLLSFTEYINYLVLRNHPVPKAEISSPAKYDEHLKQIL